MAITSILNILEIASRSSHSSLIIRQPNDDGNAAEISYEMLYCKAKALAKDIRRMEHFKERCPLIIYLSGHIQTLICFWAAVCADAIPVILPQMSNDTEQRKNFNRNLAQMFHGSVCITDLTRLHLFSDVRDQLHIRAIEQLSELASKDEQDKPGNVVRACREQIDDDLAMMLLTSGSTGGPKAVRLGHQQIVSAVRGKSAMREMPKDRPFLNWIGLDHVASMVEIHFPALYLGISQIHIDPGEMISNPVMFLDYLHEYRVARTFAPNFFLARLLKVLRDYNDTDVLAFDLRNLAWLGSGGEANDIEVCTPISGFLSAFGAPDNVLVPGFGMTETCAGAIYNLECPTYDIQCKYAFASLGRCISGIEYRLTDSEGAVVATNTVTGLAAIEGSLEVRGPVVFSGYYKNEMATREAFSPDGWFKTGDRAIIDSNGCLCLIGRASGTININGLKYEPEDLETLVEKAVKDKPLRVSCFSFRTKAAATERVCMLFVSGHHHRLESHPKELLELHNTVTQTVLICTNSTPRVLFLKDESLLQLTTLGKVSRAKLRVMFEAGAFDQLLTAQDAFIETNRPKLNKDELSAAEQALIEDFRKALRLTTLPQSAELSLLDLGLGSIDLIRLKQITSKRLNLDIPVVTFIKNPTVRSLAQAIEGSSQKKRYNPTVTLRSDGSKAPLWLVHPGVGEILVFMNLAKHLEDRPVHALRARGFEGEPYFENIEETVDVYCDAIRQEQPSGPYAIAGYSYGAMIAFEIAKRLDAQDGFGTVRFLGSFNLPPHIKWRMKQLDWTTVFLHLCHFLGLIDETYINKTDQVVRKEDRQQLCEDTLAVADKARIDELSLDLPMLQTWTELSYRLQQMAVDYDPSGRVSNIDVFVAQPLTVAAPSRDVWIQEHLAKWSDFSDHEPTFHDVLGAHYTMLNDDNVQSFARTLSRALGSRQI